MRKEEEYQSPFSTRYVSPELSSLFSLSFRAITFRKLWIALAEGQKKLGLPIEQSQIAQMKKGIEHLDFDLISSYEKKFRHDVMAHIHAFGDVCPLAKPIIHLGATSSYVTDNADLIQMKKALFLLFQKLLYVMKQLGSFAKKHQNTPCLGFTHYQPAQPTTLGKRATLWLQDFLIDAHDFQRLWENLPFLGVKGATGTQSSFLFLFGGDRKKVESLEHFVAKTFGFSHLISVAGQTYTRKIDLNIGNALASFAASAHKMATDIRLLAHDGGVREGFGKEQVGSSAMPYKKNPIYAERICGIARFVISLSQNPIYTTATQWLERSLDDSSNKRLAMGELFLGTDALLNLLCHLISHLHVDKSLLKQKLEEEKDSLVMENLLMHGVQKGESRQDLHEALRIESLKQQKRSSANKEIETLSSTKSLIGLAPDQTKSFLQKEITPYLKKHLQTEPLFPTIS